jgi:hypothetical protein
MSKSVAIHYIEISRDASGAPAAIKVVRSGGYASQTISLRRNKDRTRDIVGARNRSSVDAQVGDWLGIVDVFFGAN